MEKQIGRGDQCGHGFAFPLAVALGQSARPHGDTNDMTATDPACTRAEIDDLIALMHGVLAKLDEYGLGLPASYVQLAIDHVRAAAPR